MPPGLMTSEPLLADPPALQLESGQRVLMEGTMPHFIIFDLAVRWNMLLVILFALTVLAMPDLAFAAGAEPSFMQDTFWPNVLPLLGTVVAALASWALALLQKKIKLQTSRATDEWLRQVTRDAIHGAEEWAARKLKVEMLEGRGPVPPTGTEKAAYALNLARRIFPRLLEDEFVLILDEELAHSNAGATGSDSVAPPTSIPE